ncbi:MAG: transcriptional repressor [Geminocystis sp.]|nr:transcriptional repressor [Geminocystis sp.]HIK38095.1 transcriptional repressor [Geminocystis sp. M7585_C2015_104]MCS7149047.1 transcriptional repressor [Geminocystis sp.]MCX8077756.1 transcriptional repressor [Geminocystis sp.]MDW8117124.1 Fur family transcriptional regulator [Geminocystis sp.]
MTGKLTKSQQKILDVLKSVEGEISAQEIYHILRKNGSSTGLATVYRHLKFFLLRGLVKERITVDGESLYQLINHSHQHHFNCINCGKSVLLPDNNCPINEAVYKSLVPNNFRIYYHSLEFFGLCECCQRMADEKDSL